jgi:DNA-binding beta-propeller fold protein YncE
MSLKNVVPNIFKFELIPQPNIKMTDLKEYIINLKCIIETPCGKYLIWIEGHSIFRYCLKSKQKFRIAGSVKQIGYQDGTRDESRFDLPYGLTLSKNGETLFVTDTYNGVIRAICVVTGVTTTFAGQVDICAQVDGPKENACFIRPKVLKLSPDGNTLYIADYKCLRAICIETGQVNTIHTFENEIQDFTLSPGSNCIYICHNNKFSKYNLKTWQIVLKVNSYEVCAFSKNGQLLFVSDYFYNRIKVVNLATMNIIELLTSFNSDKLTIVRNILYILDFNQNKIQVVDISKYYINFKTFIQQQLFKNSFLPRQVIKHVIN